MTWNAAPHFVLDDSVGIAAITYIHVETKSRHFIFISRNYSYSYYQTVLAILFSTG